MNVKAIDVAGIGSLWFDDGCRYDDGEPRRLVEATDGTIQRAVVCIERCPELSGAIVTESGVAVHHDQRLVGALLAAFRRYGIIDSGGAVQAWCSARFLSARSGEFRQCSRPARPGGSFCRRCAFEQ